MSIPDTIRRCVKDAIEQRGLTQGQAAEAGGVTPAKMSKFLAGRENMRGDTLQRLFNALGIRVTADPPAGGRRKK